MSLLTDLERQKINKDNPTFQSMAFGDKVYELSTGSMIAIDFPIIVDGTGGLSIPIPYGFLLRDVIVQCTAANASGTATVRKVTTAITDAIIMAVDLVVVRAGTIDDAQSTILATDDINVITAGAADRGIVTLIGVRS